ncbi:MAG: hypothetical protein UD961_10170, partial [Bacteroidales bacterium]|nr:hypothetical protein [Bacteroidales bacterium]
YEIYVHVTLLLNPPPREEDLLSLRSKGKYFSTSTTCHFFEGRALYEIYVHVTLLLNPPPREEDLLSLRSKGKYFSTSITCQFLGMAVHNWTICQNGSASS